MEDNCATFATIPIPHARSDFIKEKLKTMSGGLEPSHAALHQEETAISSLENPQTLALPPPPSHARVGPAAAPRRPRHCSAQGTEQGRKEGCAVGEEERGGPAQRGREEGKEGEQRRSRKVGAAICQQITLEDQ